MRSVILGFDSFDPVMFQRAHAAGKMINLGKLADAGNYSTLEVCSPPQTEVSWTSIATGVDPGSHGRRIRYQRSARRLTRIDG